MKGGQGAEVFYSIREGICKRVAIRNEEGGEGGGENKASHRGHRDGESFHVHRGRAALAGEGTETEEEREEIVGGEQKGY